MANVSERSPPRWLDGNRDPARDIPAITGNVRNLDLGMGQWSIMRGGRVLEAPKRPAKLSTLGREIQIGLNTFNVTDLPSKPVYQYDVLVGSGAEKRGLVMKLWESKGFKDALNGAKGWIFDKSKLAWSLTDIDREIRVNVDLDAEEGRTVKPGGKENKHRVVIKKATTVRFDVLHSWLAGKCDWDNQCLEAITFLDHLLREAPSQKYTAIKRNFFARGEERFMLSPGVEAMKGVYQSMRLAHQTGGNHCLTVNVDIANGTFWTAGMLSQRAITVSVARGEADFVNTVMPRPGQVPPRGFENLKRLRKLHVVAGHRGNGGDEYCIDRFLPKNAREYKFEQTNAQTGKKTQTSIYDYFQQTYKIRLQHPDYPVVQMTKKAVLPLEVLKLKENQRYVVKLDAKQTAMMIKFAVTPPKERWGGIEHGLRMLDWSSDSYLKNYGMSINPKQVVVKARLLNAPEVMFANGNAKPGTSGRWDLKEKKFLTSNTKPLKSWGVCIVQGRATPDKAVVQRFLDEFIKIYTGHGGKVENRAPTMHLGSSQDPGKAVEEVWNKAGNAAQNRPQILVFILPEKDATIYGRIKKSCEARYGVVSQCMQYDNVQKCQGQYISNVCMKFNAKLGGSTARAIGANTKGPNGIFTVPTCIIGCDVSHAAPGAQTASMAAMTMSMDKLGIRYAAGCETNGFRTEMVTPENITKLLKPLFQTWIKEVGGGQFPKRIIYLRDGVSEGQFQYVLKQEVADIRALLKSANPDLNIPFTVINCGKRHHVRFFPPSGGDRNGNPLPGTLVETGVTHPRENDFYLNSHAALKGTSRPTKYHILLNEANMSQDELHTLLYEHSYQYIRATTPVSLYPAVYYAHLAAGRAIHHDKAFGASQASNDRSAGGGSGRGNTTTSDSSIEIQPLMTMPDTGGINTAMWYI